MLQMHRLASRHSFFEALIHCGVKIWVVIPNDRWRYIFIASIFRLVLPPSLRLRGNVIDRWHSPAAFLFCTGGRRDISQSAHGRLEHISRNSCWDFAFPWTALDHI